VKERQEAFFSGLLEHFSPKVIDSLRQGVLSETQQADTLRMLISAEALST
jgi:hypothetical protein